MRKGKEVSASEMELLLRTRDRNPALFERMMELLQIVNEPVTRKADDVEFSVIDNLRQLGKDALTSWAQERSEDEGIKALERDPELKRAGKKNSIGKQPTEP